MLTKANMPASGRWTVSPVSVCRRLSSSAARAAKREAIPAATDDPLRTAFSVMSAMKGWLPTSIVSETGSSAVQNSAGPTHQPLRKPGAACDLEIEETAMTRSASAVSERGDANSAPSKIRCS